MADPKFRSYRPLLQHSTNTARMKLAGLSEDYEMGKSDVDLDKLLDRRYVVATSDAVQHATHFTETAHLKSTAQILRAAYDKHLEANKQLQTERQERKDDCEAAAAHYAQLESKFRTAHSEWESERSRYEKTLEDLKRIITDAAALRAVTVEPAPVADMLTDLIRGSMGAAAGTISERETAVRQQYETRLSTFHELVQQSCRESGFKASQDSTIDVNLAMYVAQVNTKCKALQTIEELQHRLAQRVEASYADCTGKTFQPSLSLETKMATFFDGLDGVFEARTKEAKASILSSVISAMQTSWQALDWQPYAEDTIEQVREFASAAVRSVSAAESNERVFHTHIIAKIQELGLFLPSMSNMTTLQLLNDLSARYASSMHKANADKRASHEDSVDLEKKLQSMSTTIELSDQSLGLAYDTSVPDPERCANYVTAVTDKISQLESDVSSTKKTVQEFAVTLTLPDLPDFQDSGYVDACIKAARMSINEHERTVQQHESTLAAIGQRVHDGVLHIESKGGLKQDTSPLQKLEQYLTLSTKKFDALKAQQKTLSERLKASLIDLGIPSTMNPTLDEQMREFCKGAIAKVNKFSQGEDSIQDALRAYPVPGMDQKAELHVRVSRTLSHLHSEDAAKKHALDDIKKEIVRHIEAPTSSVDLNPSRFSKVPDLIRAYILQSGHAIDHANSGRAQEVEMQETELKKIQDELKQNQQVSAANFEQLVEMVSLIDKAFDSNENAPNPYPAPTIDSNVTSIEKWAVGIQERSKKHSINIRQYGAAYARNMSEVFKDMVQALFKTALDSPPSVPNIPSARMNDLKQWIKEQEASFSSSHSTKTTATSASQSQLQSQLTEMIGQAHGFVGNVFSAASVQQSNTALLAAERPAEYFADCLQSFTQQLAEKNGADASNFKQLVLSSDKELAMLNCLSRGAQVDSDNWKQYRNVRHPDTATPSDLAQAIRFHCYDINFRIARAAETLKAFEDFFAGQLSLFTSMQTNNKLPKFATVAVSKDNLLAASIFFEGVAEQLRSKIDRMIRDREHTEEQLLQNKRDANVMYTAARDLIVSVRKTMGLQTTLPSDDETKQMARVALWFGAQLEEVQGCWTRTKTTQAKEQLALVENVYGFTVKIFERTGVQAGQLVPPETADQLRDWLWDRYHQLKAHVLQEQIDQQADMEQTVARFIEYAKDSIQVACETMTDGRHPDLGSLTMETTHVTLVNRKIRLQNWLKSNREKLDAAHEHRRIAAVTSNTTLYVTEINRTLRSIETSMVEHQQLFVAGRKLPHFNFQTDNPGGSALTDCRNMRTWLVSSFTLLEQLAKREVSKYRNARNELHRRQEYEAVGAFNRKLLRDHIVKLHDTLQATQTAATNIVPCP